MISTLRNSIARCSILVVGWLFIGVFSFAEAQSDTGVSLTIAPTLIELSAEPGEVWRSNLKVVNTNTFPLTVYTDSAHFVPVGEFGQGSITPRSEIPVNENVFATWITVENEQLTIAPGESQSVSFIVTVPEDATPGSHFGALQVSTAPQNIQTTGINTAQVVSSLLFLRVAGEVEERGAIRSFTTSDSLSAVPNTELQLRFENTGNVHIRPVGEITITNMWGMERGIIPVNVNTSFGNALPNTIRTYDFGWSSEPSLFDIGLYKASAVLAYGATDKQFTSAASYFWVIPIKPILIALLIIIAIMFGIALSSRWYVSRLLAQAGMETQRVYSSPRRTETDSADDLNLATPPPKGFSLNARINSYLSQTSRTLGMLYSHTSIKTKQIALGILMILIVIGITVLWLQSRTIHSTYQATIGGIDGSVTYNAEEIAFFRNPGRTPNDLIHESDYSVSILNASEDAGAAGTIAARLVETVPVSRVGVASMERGRSVIVFPLSLQEEAVALQKLIPNAILSAFDAPTTTITVYIGAR